MAFTSYQSYVLTLAEMAAVQDMNETNFQAILPALIDYAEQRIYRDLNLLATVVRSTGTATPNTRNFSLPQPNGGKFISVQGINLMVGTTRIPLVPKSRVFMDFYAPDDTAVPGTNPSVYAMLTDQMILIGSAPATAYPVEVVGTMRPAPLSATTTTTFLTQNLPDLFLSASMILLAGYQKNFGAMADNPQSAVSWEAQYQTLLKSAAAEELRKRYNVAVNYAGTVSASPGASTQVQ